MHGSDSETSQDVRIPNNCTTKIPDGNRGIGPFFKVQIRYSYTLVRGSHARFLNR